MALDGQRSRSVGGSATRNLRSISMAQPYRPRAESRTCTWGYLHPRLALPAPPRGMGAASSRQALQPTLPRVTPLSLVRNQVHTNTFAARMGRWSARHRKTAIWGWIAFVAIAFVIGNAVGTQKPKHEDYIGESGQAARLFDTHYPKKADEQVIVQAPKGGHATDASVRKAVAETIAAVSGKP